MKTKYFINDAMTNQKNHLYDYQHGDEAFSEDSIENDEAGFESPEEARAYITKKGWERWASIYEIDFPGDGFDFTTTSVMGLSHYGLNSENVGSILGEAFEGLPIQESITLTEVATVQTGYGHWRIEVRLDVDSNSIYLSRTTTNSMLIDEWNGYMGREQGESYDYENPILHAIDFVCDTDRSRQAVEEALAASIEEDDTLVLEN